MQYSSHIHLYHRNLVLTYQFVRINLTIYDFSLNYKYLYLCLSFIDQFKIDFHRTSLNFQGCQKYSKRNYYQSFNDSYYQKLNLPDKYGG